ncbi:hypothetical protein [Aquiflexum lacus]|uniref:hypothetical protein n=1 Tax=Aquiflexum lacus TaxID=2483805 RepID=UPI00189310DE|nr:hypothetical protein [Aquiflexum lacus]
MKKFLIIVSTVFLLGSCSIFGPVPEFSQGMTERKFLRQNKEAVLSALDGTSKTYRVNRGENFYVLATFEDGKLIKLEERETFPAWMDNRPVESDGFRMNF